MYAAAIPSALLHAATAVATINAILHKKPKPQQNKKIYSLKRTITTATKHTDAATVNANDCHLQQSGNGVAAGTT